MNRLKLAGITICLSLIIHHSLVAQQRPSFHFTTTKNWINDPNGLVYSNGEYHLFYQYNPFGIGWGHMSWAHAVSKDLVLWEHLPVAIMEDTVMIFSGSCVVDKNNTSGLFKKEGDQNLVAIYTAQHTNKETQAIAYSEDFGRTFTKYSGNPVLDLNKKDFRDPKVFWYEKQKKWIMVVSLPTEFQVRFYGSANLMKWNLLGEFGNQGNIDKIWECPDLFELPIIGEPGKTKWVLLISGAHPKKDFVGMQYYIGNFDGNAFTNDNLANEVLWLDYGKDFYAAVTYNNISASDGRRIAIGWMNNWAYAGNIPATEWRGSMNFPRELTLKKFHDGYRLIQQPVAEIKKHRKEEIHMQDIDFPGANATLVTTWISDNSYELEIKIALNNAEDVSLQILKGKQCFTSVGYNKKDARMYVDRQMSGNTSFSPHFASLDKAQLKCINGVVTLHILVDKTLVEVFGNDGIAVISSQVFPNEENLGIQLFSKGGEARIISFNGWKIE